MPALNTFPVYQLLLCIEIYEMTLIFQTFPFMSFQPLGILRTHNSPLGRTPHTKVVGMLVGDFELNP